MGGCMEHVPGAQTREVERELPAEARLSVDLEDRITDADAAAEHLVGCARGELAGRVLRDVLGFSGAVPGLSWGHGTSGRSEGETVELQGLLRRRDGSRAAVSCARTSLAVDGRPTGAEIVIRTVGPHAQVEDWLGFEDALLEHVDSAIIFTDSTGRIAHWSTGAVALFGYWPEEVLGQMLALVCPDHAKLDAERALALEGRERFEEWKGRHKDGRTLWVDIRMRPLRGADGQILGVLYLGRDAGDRRLVEAARSRVLNRERDARLSSERAVERLTRLQAATAELAEAHTVEQVAQIVIEHACAALQARMCALYALDEDGGTYKLTSSRNVPAAAREPWGVLPIDSSTPLALAIETATPQWYETREQLVEAFPSLRRTTFVAPEELSATAALPLRVGARVVGGALFTFSEAIRIVGDERSFILTFIAQCAQALERARLHESERRARERAEQTASLLDALLAASPVGIGVYDRNLRFLRVNEALAAMNGTPVEAHLGRTNAEVADGRGEAIDQELREVLETGRSILAREQMGANPNEPDEQRHWLVNRFPVRSAAGEIIAVGAVVADITSRVRMEAQRERFLAELEQERQWLKRVIERLPAGIILIEGSPDRRQVHTNRRADELLGQPISEIKDISQIIGSVCDPSGRPLGVEELPYTRALLGEETSGVELLLRRADGTQLPIRSSATAIKTSEEAQPGVVIVFEDITAIKEFERLREEWTSVVAHDLRQAIGVISLSAQLAQELEKDALSHDMVTRELGRIRRTTQRLARMVDDLMDVSRIEARRLELVPHEVDLPALVSETVDRLSHLLRGSQVRVEQRHITGPVWADAGRVEQVLGNLISNALKYGELGADILVDLEGQPTEVQVTVSNRGPVIPPDQLRRLFNRFTRAQEAKHSEIPGLGLGLYICKGLVEAHGGRIWADSDSSVTRFHFTLPLASERQVARERAPATGTQVTAR